MDRYTVQEVQENLASLIESATSGNEKILITSVLGNAVLLSEECYKNLLITLEMLSTPLFMDKETCGLEDCCQSEPTSISQ